MQHTEGNKMIKVAVIIKHLLRYDDYRVDIVEVPENTDSDKIIGRVMSEMLGPFEVIAVTDRVNLDRKINLK